MIYKGNIFQTIFYETRCTASPFFLGERHHLLKSIGPRGCTFVSGGAKDCIIYVFQAKKSWEVVKNHLIKFSPCMSILNLSKGNEDLIKFRLSYKNALCRSLPQATGMKLQYVMAHCFLKKLVLEFLDYLIWFKSYEALKLTPDLAKINF